MMMMEKYIFTGIKNTNKLTNPPKNKNKMPFLGALKLFYVYSRKLNRKIFKTQT